ncbi:MAG TPA: SH3 domain-containing protein [Vicinamibacteria bacterium]|nr:SH3 domain-containing protein [Vicinamibacteria bacterium]
MRTQSRLAAGCALVLLFSAAAASTQRARTKEQARVPTSYANVHEEPGSGSTVLVLVPRDTVLPIIGRRGEWVQVELSPELRKTGMVMRWYEGKREIIRRGQRIRTGDEESGWMHDSTVEITEVEAQE